MKKWWKSKTVWLGLVVSTIGMIETIFRVQGLTVPPIVYEIEGIVTGILIIILRRLTNTGLET